MHPLVNQTRHKLYVADCPQALPLQGFEVRLHRIMQGSSLMAALHVLSHPLMIFV